MRNLSITFAIIFSFLCFSLHAQEESEEMKPTKLDNPEWYYVSKIKFKSGHYNRAKEILNDFYFKASKAYGGQLPKMILRSFTGSYDMMIVWEMKEGLTEFEWETSPDDIAFYTELIKLTGSKEEADKIIKEFQELIDTSDGQLALNFKLE
ncbi:hypothetical protein SAMN04487907_102304 [Zunongwangia mangrovi]|uniref:NIPSNAP protein n=1 Tax=Zunongwangia mangrovi TaxID=1334022 RepID=A0A1I1GJT9_9FLAO|nr:hypothetical protein [Zunongwangia mangrovi]SFC11791.1 hypothetical protein SAMN04487907_102304 [Zunongwangia mangrovi]